ncbi:NUDIX hydrolase [Nonomuraea polychroma]|uniref:NUDIX hydrolase n=1 Tax=Nonomuraea polychroma TaxID=46176 RepID=UPI003D9105BE
MGCLVFCEDEVVLIRRERPSVDHYSVPGGNVGHREDLIDALRRELAEELKLDLDRATCPQLCWVQDQMVSRPGPTAPPRKLHFVFRVHVDAEVRSTLATIEHDELPDGAVEEGEFVWVGYRSAGRLKLYPALGEDLAALASTGAPVSRVLLPPLNDRTYQWL